MDKWHEIDRGMTDEEYMALLESFDDPVCGEAPRAFDHQEAVVGFLRFVGELERAVGGRLQYETGTQVQDASFHSQVLLPGAALRFSNFGQMVSLVEDEDEVPSGVLDAIKRLLSAHGYTYVPPRVLVREYTGANPGVTDIRDWQTRYFDWL